MPQLRDLFTGHATDPLREYDPALAPLPPRMFDNRLRPACKPFKNARQHARHERQRLRARLDKALTPTLIRSDSTLRTVDSSRSAGAIIRQAREHMQRRALLYVQQHDQVIEQALHNDDPKALETARRAAQWAIENVSAEENGRIERIVDKSEQAQSLPTIQIGFALGGMPTAQEPTSTHVRTCMPVDADTNAQAKPAMPTAHVPALPAGPVPPAVVDAQDAEILSSTNESE